MKQYVHEVITFTRRDAFAGLTRAALGCVFVLYRAVARTRRMIYDAGILKRKKLPKPVISIGNLTPGGTGKTPLVAEVAAVLIKNQARPVVLTRGYMTDGAAGSDEAQVLRQLLPGVPVVVNPDRYAGAIRFLKDGTADVFILDDGLQHLPLARDCEIVVLDTTNPFGNGPRLSPGIAREPLSVLAGADIFVLTKTDAAPDTVGPLRQKLKGLNPGALIVETRHVPVSVTDLVTGQQQPLAGLREKQVVAFCSIGMPQGFTETLKGCGAHVVDDIRFIDHHRYAASDIVRIAQSCRRLGVTTAVTTLKDAVKLQDFRRAWQDLDVWCLNIALEFQRGKDEFVRRIHSYHHA